MSKFFFLAILFLFSCKTTDNTIDINKIEVEGGQISGYFNDDKQIAIFNGIPYAAAPVKDLRWKAPAPVQAWEGVKKCENYAASAIQKEPMPFYMWSSEFLIPKEPINEDCLYLNVWSPAKTKDENLPVMVFIHGGGFTSGGSAVPIYDGEALAKKGILVVSINYRVGVLGFLAHPDLTKESANNVSGNYALLDQIAALNWVKENIENFGGDAKNITIMGQSAGAVAVVYLMASPLANGLFNKVIAHSGAGLLGRSPGQNATTILNEEEQTGELFVENNGLTSIEELRKLPAKELLEQNFRPHPVIDNYLLTKQVKETIKASQQNKVKLLTGWNEDDGILIQGIEKVADFKKELESQWGEKYKTVLEFYPAESDDQSLVSQKYLQRDLAFGVQNYYLANLISQQNLDTYVYRFARKIPAGKYTDYGAFHTGEIPYVFNNLRILDRPSEDIDQALAEEMSDYWVNFIKTGDPNRDSLTIWPKYNSKTQKILLFGENTKQANLPDSKSLDFLLESLK